MMNFYLFLINIGICFHGCVTKDSLLFNEPSNFDTVIYPLDHKIDKRDVSATSTTTPFTVEVKYSGSHKYYTSKVVVHNGYWDALSDSPQQVFVTEDTPTLSVDLTFEFPFYGHKINSITISPNGFLYMSPFLHKWILATQYIAPLMANFDVQKRNTSDILYKDYGSRFVVEWRDIYLQDQIHTNPFVFQTTLYQNGSIVFAYGQIPMNVTHITTTNHPVKVGLSDAFYIDKVVAGVTRRSVYEYHRVAIDLSLITTKTVVILEPLPTCNTVDNCDECVQKVGDFKCKWCPAVSRCSDEIDWYRQNWIDNNCSLLSSDAPDICLQSTRATPSTTKFRSISTVPSTTIKSTTGGEPPTFMRTSLTTKISTVTPTTIKPTTGGETPTIMKTSLTTNISAGTTILSTTASPTTRPTTTATTTHIRTVPTTLKQDTSTNRPTTKTSMKVTTQKAATTKTKQTTQHTTTQGDLSKNPEGVHVTEQTDNEDKGVSTVAVIVTVVLLVALCIAGLSYWIYYGYTHPTSSTGLWLIEHRPSQLKTRLPRLSRLRTETGAKYKVENEADSTF